MQGSTFDEDEFFGAISRSGARAVLIGRRALVALGLPVVTADYDFWVHREDIGLLNDAVAAFDLRPTRAPADALRVGRYVLENDERVDVLVAREVTTVDGVALTFNEVWERRQTIKSGGGRPIVVPSIDDLILTKRFAARPKDAEDIRLLEILRDEGGADA